jgi:hypothetical protein
VKRSWSFGAIAAASVCLLAALWALATSEVGAFIAALPWSYLVASGPWVGSTVIVLFVPCILLNAALIYLGVAPFLRFTAKSLNGRQT